MTSVATVAAGGAIASVATMAATWHRVIAITSIASVAAPAGIPGVVPPMDEDTVARASRFWTADQADSHEREKGA
jgi:hypothetical protein